MLEAESTRGSEALGRWKIPVTPLGVTPETFQLVAQCLKQLLHRVPAYHTIWAVNIANIRYRTTSGAERQQEACLEEWNKWASH